MCVEYILSCLKRTHTIIPHMEDTTDSVNARPSITTQVEYRQCTHILSNMLSHKEMLPHSTQLVASFIRTQTPLTPLQFSRMHERHPRTLCDSCTLYIYVSRITPTKLPNISMDALRGATMKSSGRRLVVIRDVELFFIA